MADKKTFVMMEDWVVLLSKLPTEAAGKLAKAMCTYQLTGELETDDPIVEAQMAVITPIMDENNRKHEETCQKRVELGRKGAEKRWQKDGKAIANDSNCHKENSNCHSDDSKSIANGWQTMAESESESESVSRKRDNNPPLSPLGEDERFSPTVRGAVNDWLAYKRERREGYKERGRQALLTEIYNNVQQHGEDAVVSLIRQSIASGYKGIIFDRLKNQKPWSRGGGNYIDRIDNRINAVDAWLEGRGDDGTGVFDTG